MKKHQVFDNIFDYNTRQQIESRFLSYDRYKLGWNDSDMRPDVRYMYSDEVPIGFVQNLLGSIRNQDLLDKINGREPQFSVMNVSFPGYFYFPHTHPKMDALVYYVNMDWRPEWAGETFVYADNGVDIAECVPYQPGKGLWIEKEVAHSLRPPTFNAPFYRFTLSMFFRVAL